MNKHDHAAALKLSKSMTVEQMFQAIVANCIEQVQANHAGVVPDVDSEHHAESVECLHQMRVGLRRLRCAFWLFRKRLQVPADLRQEFDWLGSQLGAARDWDVLLATTMPAIGDIIARVSGEPCVLLVQKKALAQHQAASVAIHSVRYTRLMKNFMRWVEVCGWRDTLLPEARKHLEERAIGFVQHALAQGRRRLLKRQQADIDPQACHGVRISAKKLRYTAEFFADFYPVKRMRPMQAALAKLQDQLGALNDAVVADRLLAQMQQEQAALAGSAGYLRGYLAAQVEADVQRLGKRWKKGGQIKLP